MKLSKAQIRKLAKIHGFRPGYKIVAETKRGFQAIDGLRDTGYSDSPRHEIREVGKSSLVDIERYG